MKGNIETSHYFFCLFFALLRGFTKRTVLSVLQQVQQHLGTKDTIGIKGGVFFSNFFFLSLHFMFFVIFCVRNRTVCTGEQTEYFFEPVRLNCQ